MRKKSTRSGTSVAQRTRHGPSCAGRCTEGTSGPASEARSRRERLAAVASLRGKRRVLRQTTSAGGGVGCARACARASHQRFQGHLVELARVQVDLVLRIVAGREVGLRRRRQIVSTVEPAHAEVRLHLVAPANLRQDLLDPCDPGLRVGPGLQVDALMQRVAGAADLADRSGRRCGARSAKRSGCRCQVRAWPRDKHRWKEGWKGQAGQRPCRTTISQGRSLCSRIQQAELVRCAAEAVCAHLYTVQAGHAACTARCWRTRLLAPLSWTISESLHRHL